MRGQEAIPGVRTTHVGYVDAETREDVKFKDDHIEPLFLVSGGDLFVMGQLIEEWCTVTSSSINASKCALLVWERDCQDPIPWAFKLAGQYLRPVRSAKLLGVRWSTIDQKLQVATVLHEAHRRVARLARFKGLPPETVSRILNVGILPVLLQSAIAFTTATATGEIETQVAIDAAVRAASQVPAMSVHMLRLPVNHGGLGVPDVRVATWLRVLNGDTVAATVLQCEMQRVDLHSVAVTRTGENMIPLAHSVL